MAEPAGVHDKAAVAERLPCPSTIAHAAVLALRHRSSPAPDIHRIHGFAQAIDRCGIAGVAVGTMSFASPSHMRRGSPPATLPRKKRPATRVPIPLVWITACA